MKVCTENPAPVYPYNYATSAPVSTWSLRISLSWQPSFSGNLRLSGLAKGHFQEKSSLIWFLRPAWA